MSLHKLPFPLDWRLCQLVCYHSHQIITGPPWVWLLLSEWWRQRSLVVASQGAFARSQIVLSAQLIRDNDRRKNASEFSSIWAMVLFGPRYCFAAWYYIWCDCVEQCRWFSECKWSIWHYFPCIFIMLSTNYFSTSSEMWSVDPSGLYPSYLLLFLRLFYWSHGS